MQCQAEVQTLATPGASVRCPNRAVSAFQGKFICRRHLAIALGELRGDDAATTTWWEIMAAEAEGKCYYCGAALRPLPRPQSLPDGTLAFFDACQYDACRRRRQAAYRAAMESGAFIEE
ncbi:MAG TPA: hypothetical protein VHS99_08270 [Chloroflexota bacterium]|nr:hypothetical protein [Chloroflexota bacterium]